MASGQSATAEPSDFLSYARVVSRIASYALVLAILAGVTSANHPLGPAPARAAVAPRLAVSPSGSDTNDCTTARPCKTLARAFGVARAGDVVSIAGGEYPGERITGSRGGPVTFEAAPKAKVLLTGPLELPSAANVVVRGLEVSHAVPGAGVVVGPCSSNVVVENVVAKSFVIFEGTVGATIKGGSYGGYNTPSVEEDSAIGTSGRGCDGSSPPARNIVFDGVQFHDSYWPVHSREDFGTSHPDCFQIIGNVDGLTIRNSVFERCGDSFIGAFPDQGDFTNVVIEHNTFRQLGGFTYFGMQISGQTHPYRCSNVTIRGNYYWPDNPTSLSPYSGIRLACPNSAITGNLFQQAPSKDFCDAQIRGDIPVSYADNVYIAGPACGSTAKIPWGYVVDGSRLSVDPARATVIRRVYALARKAKTRADVAKNLKAEKLRGQRPWTASSVAAILAEERYTGGTWGRPGTQPAIVKRATWRAAQRLAPSR